MPIGVPWRRASLIAHQGFFHVALVYKSGELIAQALRLEANLQVLVCDEQP